MTQSTFFVSETLLNCSILRLLPRNACIKQRKCQKLHNCTKQQVEQTGFFQNDVLGDFHRGLNQQLSMCGTSINDNFPAEYLGFLMFEDR